MISYSHDPRERIRGMQQILISDKKRIGFLFGAGSSFATGVQAISVPAVAEMTTRVLSVLNGDPGKFSNAVEEIKNEVGIESFNIESLLSNIEAKRTIIGPGTLNGLVAADFLELMTKVKKEIVKLVSVHETLTVTDIGNLAHSKLSSWISKARRSFPAEIFTTNYDYLFEIALEKFGTPYFDGFSGSYEPFFCPEAVEDIEAYRHLVKLWKMHGSLGWTYRESEETVVRNKSVEAEPILIYPSHLKYSSSKKQPYIGLIDRLCTFLQQDDAVLITCGYSFSDSHINERIATSLRRGADSHVVAMYYDEYFDADSNAVHKLSDTSNTVRRMATHETAGKMSVYGVRHAVIGGKFGEWRLRAEPDANDSIHIDQYFDEDAAALSNETGQHKGDEEWTGTGRLLLPDFCKLTEFLDSLSSPDSSSSEIRST